MVIDETDPANVLVTTHTAPEQRGVQAVVQLDWEDAPTGVTTDADGVATFPPYSLPYATTFIGHHRLGHGRRWGCTASTTTIPTAPPPSCELFVDTSNAPADVVTVETFPHLAGRARRARRRDDAAERHDQRRRERHVQRVLHAARDDHGDGERRGAVHD